MADNGSKLSWILAGVVVVGAVGVIGFLYNENRTADRQLAELQRDVTGGGKMGGMKPPPAPVASTDDFLPAVSPRPEVQVFLDRLKLNRRNWATLVKHNNEWLAALRNAQRDPSLMKALEVESQARLLKLNIALGSTPDGIKAFEQFTATLTGTRVVVTGPDGRKYEGVELE